MKKEKETAMKKRRIIFVVCVLAIGFAIFFAANPAKIFKKEATGTTTPPTTAVKVVAEETEEAPSIIAGKSAIPAFDNPKVKIYNSNVTKNSRILVTIGPTSSVVNKNLKVSEIKSGSFTVSTTDNDISGEIIPFSYLIVN